MRKMHCRFFCLSFLLLSACALEPSYRAQAIKPAYPPMVVDCQFLGVVDGQSNISFIDYGEQEARYQALDKAARVGATHVVWTEMQKGAKPHVQGKIYRCID